MKRVSVRRWFGAGLSGAMFVLMLALSIAPVAAADPLVVPVPGQDPQSPVQVVTSPQFGTGQLPGAVQTGFVPANGQYYYNNGQYYYTGGVPAGVTGQYYFVNGQYYDANGNLVSGVPTSVTPIVVGGGGYPGYYGGYCGYYGNCGVTAAGPIAGVTQNGTVIVRDARTGDFDTYVICPNGKYHEADANGNLVGGSC